MHSKHINDQLLDAVASHDVKLVSLLLEKGADPNYRAFEDEDEPNGYIQPTTPLRTVMFCN